MEWIYRLAMQRRRAASLQRRAAVALPCPIISVGNLTTGGTGKTPAVQWLTRILQSGGYKVGVAARGYGGKSSEAGALVFDGNQIFLDAVAAGDEAILHASNLPGAVVAIAKDRHRAVEICVENGASVVLLDDGFQFWSLPRVFEIVLLDARHPLGNGHLLPWGRLREEPEALERADVIILTRSDQATDEEIEHSQQLIGEFTEAPIIFSRHEPRSLRNEKTGEVISLDFLKRRTFKAFAGLANNGQFYKSLASLGVDHIVKLKREHGDHYAWKAGDFVWTESAPTVNQHQKNLFNALPIITTEKDAVKLDAGWFTEPLYSLKIDLEVEREDALRRLLFETLKNAAA